MSRKSAGWVLKSFFILAIVGTFLVSACAGGVFWIFSKDLPKIITVNDYRPPIVTTVVADSAKGEQTIGEFFKLERRYVIPYGKIPDRVVKAFISAEDDQFFQHGGVSWVSMI